MKYCCYFRVSTDKQGIRGLGMDAQEHAVRLFLNGQEPIASFSEVESGKVKERPELQKALELCKREKATLVIAKLDRLARHASFVLGLRDSGVEFVACDHPQANRLTIGILACVAEHERECISQRTKEGLAAAKRRGIKLGNPRWQPSLARAYYNKVAKATAHATTILPVIDELKQAGVTTLVGLADCLNMRGLRTCNGNRFFAQTVKNLLER